MSILSAEFLLFGLAVLIGYYAMPIRFRPWVLLASSVLFAALSGWQTLLHLSAVTLLAWGGTWILNHQTRGRRLVLALLLVMDLGTMVLLKFQPTMAGWVNAWLGGDEEAILSVWNMALPLGLSYFTFQSAGYLIDAYRGKVKTEHNLAQTALFMMYFPQLSQGPISSWKELGDQLCTGHRLEPDQFVSGFQLLLWGYFKKLVLADRMVPTTTILLQDQTLPGWMIMLCVAMYAVRLYMDFSGGMDVVHGFSRMLGIELPINFKRPFFADGVADYWRRWHISLGAWFRSYLLYPFTTSRAGIGLGRLAGKLFGKRAGRVLPSAIATMLVFLLIGLWHGASWNAVIYGGYFGVIMAISMLMEPAWKALRRSMDLPKNGWMRALRILRTLLIVWLAQYFAFTESAEVSISLLQRSFANWFMKDGGTLLTGLMSSTEWMILGIGTLIVLAVDVMCEKKIDVCGRLAKGSVLIRWPLLLLLLLAVLVFGIYGAGYDSTAFLYAQF